ncbi:MAG: hypothetical protein HYX48_00990 [Chlamydiales bacterium]|nr:hypothetical protein [Chlamydiales bacterium]
MRLFIFATTSDRFFLRNPHKEFIQHLQKAAISMKNPQGKSRPKAKKGITQER